MRRITCILASCLLCVSAASAGVVRERWGPAGIACTYPDSMKVTYWSPHFPYCSWNEWLCFDHSGYAAKKAAQRWVRLGGQVPTPASVDEALERSDELVSPDEIKLQKDGKFWRVL